MLKFGLCLDGFAYSIVDALPFWERRGAGALLQSIWRQIASSCPGKRKPQEITSTSDTNIRC